MIKFSKLAEENSGNTQQTEQENSNSFYDRRINQGFEVKNSEQDNYRVEPEAEAPQVTDAFYSPSWVLEEQQNRMNPDYVSPISDEDMDPQTFDTLASAVLNRQQNNWQRDPEGKPIDPGWNSDDPVWKDYFKPLEDARIAQQETEAVQAEAIQAPETQTPNSERVGADVALPEAMEQQQPGRVTSSFRTTPQQTPKTGNEIFQEVMARHPEFNNQYGTKADFDNMQNSEKIVAMLFPSAAGTDIENMPEAARYTQGLISSAFSAGGIGSAGELIAGLFGLNPGAWLKLGLSVPTFGYNYTKYLGLHEGSEKIDKLIELTDWGDSVGQKAMGNLALAVYNNTGNELNDPGKFIQNLDYIFKHPKEIFNALRGKHSGEYDSAVWDAVLNYTSNVGADWSGNLMSRMILNSLSRIADEDPNVLEKGQTTRANQGQTGVYTPEYYGTQALLKLAEIGQELYDEGITDPKTLETYIGMAISGEYGDIGNVSEFTEHEMFDVANSVENQQARGIEIVAKATGDANLATAAGFVKGNFAADVLDNIPVLPDIVRAIGRDLTKNPDFMRTSGGYNEVFAQWNIENLNSPTEQLTARDRRYSGITEDGKISDKPFAPNRRLVTPNQDPNEVKNPFVKAKIAIDNFFSPTNEYKASFEGDAIFEYIASGIEDALSATKNKDTRSTVERMNQFIDELANPETIPADSPVSTMASSALFNSVKDDVALAVRSKREEIAKAIQKYEAQSNNRAMLETVAEALGMTPAKVLDLYEKKKTALTQMIINKADENGGVIPGINFEDGAPIPVDSREFGDGVIKRIAVFTGKNSEAWNVQQLTTQISSSIADGVADVVINKYNIKPEGFLYRFGDMIKKMQNLVLLGLSPSYLANNFINNVATRTALGYGGYMSGKMIDEWIQRFGFMPERLKESFTDVFTEKSGSDKEQTNYEKLNARIRKEKKKVDGKDIEKGLSTLMEKVGDAGSWASKKFGVFGNISGKIEELESKQIVARSMMTYMARTWKPGVNFRKMPVQLEAALGPDMAKAVYSAISAGVNMEEVENAIYGSYIAPSVQDTLLDAAQNCGLKDADNIVTEYFVGNGMLAQLNEALKNKRGDEIGKIIDDFSQHLKTMLAVQLSEDLSKKAEAVAKNTKNIKFSEALEWANNISDNMMEVWLNSQEANSNLFQRRLREGLSAREFHALYQEQQKNLNEQWQGVYHQSEQTWSGILKGLGFKTKELKDYLSALHDKNQLWANFYEKTQPEIFQPYLDSLVWRPDDTADTFEDVRVSNNWWDTRTERKRVPGTWDSRVKKAWDTYVTAMQKKMQEVYTEEAKLQAKMDKAFISGLQKSVGKDKAQQIKTTIVPMIEGINAQRQAIIEKVREIRSIADKTSVLAEKDEAWRAAMEERRQLTADYYKKQQELYNAIAEIGVDAVTPAEEITKTPGDDAVSVKTDIAEDEADEFKKVAEQFSKMMVDAVLNGEDGLYEMKLLRMHEAELNKVEDALKKVEAEIDALQKENNPEKNLDELRRLNNERMGLRMDETRLLNEIDTSRKTIGEALAPNGWSEALTRKNLYNIAKRMGAEEDLAIAYAQLNKAHADEVERNNPGMKYFRDGGGMTVNYIDIERTVNGAGLYQATEVTDDLKSLLNEKYELQKLANTIYKYTDYVTLSDAIEEVARYRKLSDEIFNLYDVSIYKGATASSIPLYKFKEATDFTNAVMNDIGMMPYSTKGLTDAGLSEKLNKNVNESYASLVALNNALENFLYDQKHGYTSQKLSKSQVLGLFGMEDNDQLYYRPSELIEAYTGTEEFQNFYGDAPEMRDENGDPIVVYHGGRDNTLTYFDTEKRGSNAGGYDTKEAFYYSKSPIAAGSYGRNTNDNALELITRYLNNVRRVDLDYDISQYNSTSEAIDGALSDIRKALESLDIDPTHSESLYNDILTMYDDLHKKYDNGDYTLDDLAKDYDFAEFANVESAIRYLQDYGQYIIEEYNQAHPKADWYAKPYYLSIKNPYVVDYQGKRWSDLTPIIKEAKKGGHDGVIINNIQDGGRVISTDYLIFKPNQAKSIYNEGPFSLDTKNVYRQEQQQRIKGQFTIEDGQKFATLFKGSDMSTLIHETMGHGWATTLNDGQVEALAAYNGWTPERYRQLENQWFYDPDGMSEADRQAWIDSQEKFAYGFEQYLLEGIAPNSKMKEIFECFKRYLLEIYKGVKNLLYKGEPIDIHEEHHGVTLAEIFDSLLVDSDREFNIDRTGLEDVQSKSIEGSYGYSIPENLREFLMSDMAKLGEKVNAMKASAEEAMRNETQTFLNENKKWALTPEEQVELVTEIMHELGLNMDLPEDLDLQSSVQEKMSHFPGGEKAVRRFIDEHRATAANISDEAMTAMLKNNADRSAEMYKYVLYQTESPEQGTTAVNEGKAVAIDQVDYSTLKAGESRSKTVEALAKQLWTMEQKDKKFDKEGARSRYTLDDYIAYIYDSKDQNGEPVLSEKDRAVIYAYLKAKDKKRGPEKEKIDKEITRVRTGIKYDYEMPAKGTFVVQTYAFEHGQYNIVGAVFHDGKLVAYIPEGVQKTDVDIKDGKKATIIGVSVENPEQAVYIYDGKVKTVKDRSDSTPNPYKPEMERLSMPVLDPVPEAHHKMVYEDIKPILDEFKRLYTTGVNNAMMGNNYSSLADDTKEMLRQYIDVTVRQDMMNTKFKAAKAGEMMRDAALLNYSKRYGFDNVYSLLCPYQFWNTRSFMNWMRRIGTKGGKYWRRYARLKELEERNQKEFMPSRVSGMMGLYVPGLPDWMGDYFFFSPNQYLVVPEFLDPFLDTLKDKNAVVATAKRLLQEKLDNKDISQAQYMAAINPETQKDSPEWAQAYAEAQLEQGGGNEFADLTRKWFGLSLPLSIGEAISEGDPSKWSQFPMTRLGTAARAVIGNNWVGKKVEELLSAPERALRDAVTKATGDDTFVYKEFGSFAETYIRNQVWDMVVEGRIEAPDALQACIEKDGNKIWEEAADRQREEVLTKMQGGAVADAVKKMIKDVFTDKKEDSFKDDFYYLLASLASAPSSKQIVRESEQIWRERNAELSETYENNDKEARNKFYEENPDHRYNSLRWESDPEQSLRKYCYNTIMDVWFSLDDAEKRQIEMSFDSDFKDYVINSKTRAIETMDLNKLVGYAQAMNGKVPYLATDKLSTANATKYNIMDIPQTEMDAYNIYRKERETQYPGMADVNEIYWKLPPEERETFKKMRPDLDAYQQWDQTYKDTHPELKKFNARVTDYYNMLEAEKVCASLDRLTMQAFTRAALSGTDLNEIYRPMVINAMRKVGTTKTYKKFVENINNYILGK